MLSRVDVHYCGPKTNVTTPVSQSTQKSRERSLIFILNLNSFDTKQHSRNLLFKSGCVNLARKIICNWTELFWRNGKSTMVAQWSYRSSVAHVVVLR